LSGHELIGGGLLPFECKEFFISTCQTQLGLQQRGRWSEGIWTVHAGKTQEPTTAMSLLKASQVDFSVFQECCKSYFLKNILK